MVKFRGKIALTLELIEQILDPDGAKIVNIARTGEDLSRDTVTLFLESDKKTKYTFETAEGAKSVSNYYDTNKIEEFKRDLIK